MWLYLDFSAISGLWVRKEQLTVTEMFSVYTTLFVSCLFCKYCREVYSQKDQLWQIGHCYTDSTVWSITLKTQPDHYIPFANQDWAEFETHPRRIPSFLASWQCLIPSFLAVSSINVTQTCSKLAASYSSLAVPNPAHQLIWNRRRHIGCPRFTPCHGYPTYY